MFYGLRTAKANICMFTVRHTAVQAAYENCSNRQCELVNTPISWLLFTNYFECGIALPAFFTRVYLFCCEFMTIMKLAAIWSYFNKSSEFFNFYSKKKIVNLRFYRLHYSVLLQNVLFPIYIRFTKQIKFAWFCSLYLIYVFKNFIVPLWSLKIKLILMICPKVWKPSAKQYNFERVHFVDVARLL